MPNRRTAEVFPPGEFVREELEERGWTQSDLAEILGRPLTMVNQLIVGRKGVTPETAKGLAEAFGTTAELWMNLESAYRLHRNADNHGEDDSVSRRARLFTKAPVKEMVKRGWIESSSNIQVLEKRICDFFEIRSLDEDPKFWLFAAKKSTSYSDATPSQRAWLFRARQLARLVSAKSFSPAALDSVLEKLRTLRHEREEARQIPRLLSDFGIRLVILEPLAQTRIDGACFWLDARSPVIALSLRFDRIDSFWHALMHEMGHLSNRDGLKNDERPLDIDLIGERASPTATLPEAEVKANTFASRFLIPEDEMQDFIARTKPLYSKPKIRGFAHRIGVHPGIVVGQLQFRGEIPWAHSRDMLAKVRDVLASSSLTDGWGFSAPRL